MPRFGIGGFYFCIIEKNEVSLKYRFMTLWKIEAKNNWNWGKGKELIKGMFIEMPTPSTAPPLGLTKYHETIAQLFNTKYRTNFDKSKINAGHFICTKI